MLLVYRFILGLVCPLFLPAFFVLEKKKQNLITVLGFLEIRQPLADGWWYTSRLTGYLRKFPTTGSHLRPLDLTKTAAWMPIETHPLHCSSTLDLYIHGKFEAAGVRLISGICAAQIEISL